MWPTQSWPTPPCPPLCLWCRYLWCVYPWWHKRSCFLYHTEFLFAEMRNCVLWYKTETNLARWAKPSLKSAPKKVEAIAEPFLPNTNTGVRSFFESAPLHLFTCTPAQGWRGLLSRCGRPAGRGGEADSDGPRVGPSYHRATDVRWTGGGVTDKVCLWDIVHFVSSSPLVCILLYKGAIWS